MITDAAVYAVYLSHLREGRLAYQYSPGAQRAVFFPRAVSPHDVNETLEWRVSQGLGVVYSSTVVAAKEGPGYNVALIDCDEGFRLMSRVQGCAPDEVAIGMRVKFEVHVPQDADPYPVFIPVKDASA